MSANSLYEKLFENKSDSELVFEYLVLILEKLKHIEQRFEELFQN